MIILEILPCIPMVIIFAFLDLEKTISLSDTLLSGCTGNQHEKTFFKCIAESINSCNTLRGKT